MAVTVVSILNLCLYQLAYVSISLFHCFSCIAALLGAKVILTDLPDRLKLLRKNVEVNLHHSQIRGSAIVSELTWGDDLYIDLIDPLPDFGDNLLTFSILSHNYEIVVYI